jgi:hypothetical protein
MAGTSAEPLTATLAAQAICGSRRGGRWHGNVVAAPPWSYSSSATVTGEISPLTSLVVKVP